MAWAVNTSKIIKTLLEKRSFRKVIDMCVGHLSIFTTSKKVLKKNLQSTFNNILLWKFFLCYELKYFEELSLYSLFRVFIY